MSNKKSKFYYEIRKLVTSLHGVKYEELSRGIRRDIDKTTNKIINLFIDTTIVELKSLLRNTIIN